MNTGASGGYPKAVALQGHIEYSIHFGHLERVAKKLNMCPKVTCLVDLLHFDKNIRVVDAVSWYHINNYLLPFLNRKRLSDTVYTEQMIKEEIGDVFGRLLFVSFSHVGTGDVLLDPANFLVLELEA